MICFSSANETGKSFANKSLAVFIRQSRRTSMIMYLLAGRALMGKSGAFGFEYVPGPKANSLAKTKVSYLNRQQ